MAISVSKLEAYIGAELNVMITGYAGTGKTMMMLEACKNLGLRVKYYSASTLDPFADLVGVPVPDVENKRLDFYRPREVDEAQVIFIDELNRASEQTLNAFFEIIQFGSINGEKLPNLLCVVAAINPVEDGYHTEELDTALLDRFDVFLESDVVADPVWLKKKYGSHYAAAGVEMFNEYQKGYNNPSRDLSNTMGYFSPRRLDKFLKIFKLFPKPSTFAEVLPADVIIDSRGWTEKLNVALGNQSDTNSIPIPVRRIRSAGGPVGTVEGLNTQLLKNAAGISSKHNSDAFLKAYRYAKAHHVDCAEKLLTTLAEGLRFGVSVDNVEKLWLEAVRDFDIDQRAIVTAPEFARGIKGKQWAKLFEAIDDGIV